MMTILIILILNFFGDNLPILQPIHQTDFKYISSPFGWREHPLHGDSKFHNGIDIATKTANAKIYATANGVIQKVNTKESRGEGLSILIQHQYGFQTKYAHLSQIVVQENEAVKAGQVIGIIGDTGNTTGRHLHYEIIYEGTAVDPLEVQKGLAK